MDNRPRQSPLWEDLHWSNIWSDLIFTLFLQHLFWKQYSLQERLLACAGLYSLSILTTVRVKNKQNGQNNYQKSEVWWQFYLNLESGVTTEHQVNEERRDLGYWPANILLFLCWLWSQWGAFNPVIIWWLKYQYLYYPHRRYNYQLS